MVTIPLSRDQFQLKKLELTKKGISFSDPAQDSGRATYSGITVEYEFTGTVLVMTVVQRPFMAPVSSIESTMRKWFETESAT